MILPYRYKIIYFLLFVLIILSIISYLPTIFLNPGLYSKLHLALLVSMLGLVAFTNNFKVLFNNSFLNKILISIILFSPVLLIVLALGLRFTIEDFSQLTIVYMSVWVGYELKYNNTSLILLLYVYSIFALILGVGATITYMGGFSMSGNMYDIVAKNQIGAIVATGALFPFYIANTYSDKKNKLFSTLLTIALVGMLLIIRCRTALLAFLIAGFIIFIKAHKTSDLLKYSLLIFFVLIVFSQEVFDLLYDAFIGNRNVESMDDLSSNRFERNTQAINYIFNNLFTGELKYHSGIDIIHNYLLNRLVLYGIWSMPLIYCYFVFISRIVRYIISTKRISFNNIGYFVLIIPFFCSLLEPDAPFGPGTVQAFLFIIFGYSLKNK